MGFILIAAVEMACGEMADFCELFEVLVHGQTHFPNKNHFKVHSIGYQLLVSKTTGNFA